MKKIIAIVILLLFITLSVAGVVSANSFRDELAAQQANVTAFCSDLAIRGMKITPDLDIVTSVSLEEVTLSYGEQIDVVIEVPSTGDYHIVFHYYPLNLSFEQNTINLLVNGELPMAEAEQVNLPNRFVFTDHTIRLNRRNVQIYPAQEMLRMWETWKLRTGNAIPGTCFLTLHLPAGSNRLSIIQTEGSMMLGEVSLLHASPLPSHQEYLTNFPQSDANDVIILEAEQFYYKNRDAIAIHNDSRTSVSPFSSSEVLFNAINPTTFGEGGDRLVYFIEITAAGFYNIGIRGNMPNRAALAAIATVTINDLMPIFMDIEINGQIPFAEFHNRKIDYDMQIRNIMFDDTPVFLTEGIHKIAFVINDSIYGIYANRVQELAAQVNEFSLALLRITGNNQDRNREWELDNYLPGLVTMMESWVAELEDIKATLLTFTDGRNNEVIQGMDMAIANIERLMEEPNTAPFRMSLITQGPNSTFQALQRAVIQLNMQSFTLDQIIVAGVDSKPEELPMIRQNIAFNMIESVRMLVHHEDPPPAPRDDPNTIDVWIRQSQQHFDVASNIINSHFVAETKVNVNLVMITDQQALALANAAGKQPDVILGLDSWYVQELAQRGALSNLRQFPGAQDLIETQSPGALLQMILDDQLFGLLEIQHFSMMYYRTDILDAFGLAVPQTWDDVLLMLPALQRNGMNFYTPLASTSALKAWPATMPFYALFGAEVYPEDGMGSLIGSQEGLEAMRFMTDLFMIYGMPMQVGSFFYDFRAGRLPIGIDGFNVYILLRHSAPEMEGLWNIAPIPGKMNEEGVIERWTTGGGGAVSIFKRSQKQEIAWEFVRWWLSDETQILHMQTLQSTYGPEFLWHSGNVNALTQMPIPQRHLAVIAEQIQWIKEAPRIPGGYTNEREVSNAFTRIVYSGYDVKTAVDNAVIRANREILRRMEEFGYVDQQGNILRPFRVPSIGDVERWRNEQ